jgi:membrane fusion protein (multidrug efflux system)
MSFGKRITRTLVLWAGPLVVAGAGFYLYMHGGRLAETDNAYVKTGMTSISSELTGRVVGVFVADDEHVTKGQKLFSIDDSVYHIALARAEANLLKVHSDIESLRADYLNKQGDIRKAQTDADYYHHEYERLNKLAGSGAISETQVDQAKYAAQNAEKQLEITQQALQVVKARLVDPDLPVEQHPDYKLALAERDKAELDLSHVDVYAPIDGVLANFKVKVGEVAAGGVPLFDLVNDKSMWIEANYKETDLTYLRVGQPATIRVDAYPDFEWKGRVEAVVAGTGSEFSLLPAQNSSGNWVKVVQRVTVKITIDPQPDAPALTAGMSTLVEVDTGHQRQLPWAARN